MQTEEWASWVPIDEQMGCTSASALLYVASTRACDHLVVSLHRKARRTQRTRRASGPTPSCSSTAWERCSARCPTQPRAQSASSLRRASSPGPIQPYAEWAAERATALARASVPTAVAATAHRRRRARSGRRAHRRAAEAARDLDLPPWLKGRYGTAVGRAVHGTLQTIDLATGDGLDAAVAAQCEAEAIPGRTDQVRQLAVHALSAPSVRAAAGGRHWREVYACAPVDGRLLEGYIDLLYATDDGLVVVDYKTAATDDPAELDRRTDGTACRAPATLTTASPPPPARRSSG